MNILTKPTLLYYIEQYPLAANSLQTWYDELLRAKFHSFNELKATYGNASIIANNRVIFNIRGNHFRLIVHINFDAQTLYIIWFGSHSAYDKIDAANIKYIKKTELTTKNMSTNWKVLKSEDEYDIALERTIEIFDAKRGSADFEELELLILLVKDYEDRHFHIPAPDPIEAIKQKLEEKGLKHKDLEPIIGSKSYVSQVLSGKKELTLKMVRGLHGFLGISADILLATENKYKALKESALNSFHSSAEYLFRQKYPLLFSLFY